MESIKGDMEAEIENGKKQDKENQARHGMAWPSLTPFNHDDRFPSGTPSMDSSCRFWVLADTARLLIVFFISLRKNEGKSSTAKSTHWRSKVAKFG